MATITQSSQAAAASEQQPQQTHASASQMPHLPAPFHANIFTPRDHGQSSQEQQSGTCQPDFQEPGPEPSVPFTVPSLQQVPNQALHFDPSASQDPLQTNDAWQSARAAFGRALSSIARSREPEVDPRQQQSYHTPPSQQSDGWDHYVPVTSGLRGSCLIGDLVGVDHQLVLFRSSSIVS